ncbi:MAG: multiheme c-type cytochrome [Planctomycetia bacterium]|nr:multiheme c-type cytochrome [Planctomycetia bacterium]
MNKEKEVVYTEKENSNAKRSVVRFVSGCSFWTVSCLMVWSLLLFAFIPVWAQDGSGAGPQTNLKFVSPGTSGIDARVPAEARPGVEVKLSVPASQPANDKTPASSAAPDTAPVAKPVVPASTSNASETTSEKGTGTAPAAGTTGKSSLLDRLNAASGAKTGGVKTDSAKAPEVPSAPAAVAPVKEEQKYDPIKENGEYFVGWKKPKAAILLTGLLDGYIEPCGCAGMDRMKGGLSRRHSFVNSLRQQGWNLFVVDAGQIANGFGVQEELKFDMVMNAMRLMDCNAIGIGRSELRFPAHFLLTFTAPPSMTEQSRLVSANVALYSFNELYTLPFKVLEQEGKRVGVTSVVFPTTELSHRDENILIEDPETKLREILPQLEAKKCEYHVLIVHGTKAETTALAEKFPLFDIVVCSDSPSVPPAQPIRLSKGQSLIEVGEKGKYGVVLGFYDDEQEPVRYQRVALDSRYDQSKEVHILMEEYQTILKNLIETKGYREGLGLSLAESPKRPVLGDYVGSAQCESCHEESYRVWRKNSHSTAWQSLTKTASPPRDFDPECISCHVVGWHGIENFPYQGGFVSEKTTPQLANVGCESCHGPGSKHVEAELGKDTNQQESIRAAMRLGNDVRKVCFTCHDGDNSPEFDFETYYPKIEHKEK